MASTATNGEEPPSKNKNPSLPDDLVVSCLARVSRLHYPSLTFVSKSFGSLLTSPELYRTRSLLNRTESCLYVCLRFRAADPSPHWFTLCRKPNQTLSSKKKKKESSGYVLAPIPFTNSPPVEWKDLIAVDHSIYAICEPTTTAPCSNVSYLDCRTHTWLEAPSLRLGHIEAMYLAGSCENPESFDFIEVFNTETQTWKPVPSDSEKRKLTCGDMEGKIYIYVNTNAGRKAFTRKPKVMAIEGVGLGMGLHRCSFCTIGGTVYSYCSGGQLKWTICGPHVSRKVEGLEGLPMFPRYSSVNLVDYGGKLMVFWDKYLPASLFTKKMIWCAVISLEKRGSEEIWGKVEWFDAVLTVPRSYKFVYATTATL